MSLKCKPMYLSLPFSAKYYVCCRLSAPQCLLELSAFSCKCLGLNRFKKAYRCRQGSQTLIRRRGHLVSLPEQNRYRSPNFAGNNKLSRYFHVIYRSAESEEKYLQSPLLEKRQLHLSFIKQIILVLFNITKRGIQC